MREKVWLENIFEYLYGKRFGSKIFSSIYTGKGLVRKYFREFMREKVWLENIFEPNLFPYKYSNILKPSHPSYLPAYEDGTECSETSAYKIQTPGNYPEESIQQI
jgi:hypothetical protein